MSIRIDMNKFLEFEIQNPNLWEFFIDGDSDLKFRVRSCSLPFLTFETENQYHYHYPVKRQPLEEISVVFLEDTKFKILNYFKDWQNEIYDHEKKVFKIITSGKNNAKRNASIIYQEFSNSTYPTANRSYVLYGLFPKQIAMIENTYDNTEAFLVTVTFTIDDVKTV